MTDKAMADKVYIEPMTVEAVQEIIKKEHPDSLLPNLGGQTGLNLAMELCENGFLDKMGVKLLGANPTTIAKAEDRQMFKDTMEKIGEPIIASKVVHSVEDAVDFTREIGLPVIIRPGVHARRHRRRHCLHLGAAARNCGLRHHVLAC